MQPSSELLGRIANESIFFAEGGGFIGTRKVGVRHGARESWVRELGGRAARESWARCAGNGCARELRGSSAGDRWRSAGNMIEGGGRKLQRRGGGAEVAVWRELQEGMSSGH